MKRIERYVFRQAAGAVILVLLSLTTVVWIAVALKQLNLMTSQGQDTLVFLKMTLLALPNLMGLITPFALLVASIFVLNRLAADSELIVLSAAGASVWCVAKPLLLLAILVALMVSTVNHFAMPWSLRQLRDMIIEVRTDLINQVIQPGRFSAPENNLTFHIRDRSRSGELQGLLMHDARDPKQTATYLAERGVIVKQQAQAFLVMQKGHILRQPTPTEPVQIIAFDSYAIDLSQFEQKTDVGGTLKPRERYYHELVDPKSGEAVGKSAVGQLRAELHERFSSALYPFAFVMIVIAFAGHAQSTRQNRTRSVAMAFATAATMRVVGLSAMNLAAIQPRAVALLYALPVGACLIATAFAWRNARPRRSNFLARWSASSRAGGRDRLRRQPQVPVRAAATVHRGGSAA